MITQLGSAILLTCIFSNLISICFSKEGNGAVPASSENGLIPAMDSDYLFLDVKPSLLPFSEIGNGVFAMNDIPAGEILCEYRGPIIDDEIPFPSNKMYNIFHDGKKKKILGDTICSLINDCAAIYGAKYSVEDIKRLKESEDDEMPPYDGYRYNAKGMVTTAGKVFIVSTEFIKAGSEIYYSYGK
jgi:hypothetical protein